MSSSASSLCIVGAGPVGSLCALALRENGFAGDIALLDASPSADAALLGDRVLALSYGSRIILERLGVWSSIKATHAMTEIDVTQQGHFGLTRIRAADCGVPALGYTLLYADLKRALDQALGKAGLAIRYGARVASLTADPAAAMLTLQSGEKVQSALAVVADGAGEGLPGLKVWSRDPGQSAVLCRLRVEKPKPTVAYERFTPKGPLALLPINDREASLVWTHARADVDAVLALPADEFCATLRAEFGNELGAFERLSAPKSFPLGLRFTEPRVSTRLVAIGNAAQALHPIAGQGLNLGLRDAVALAKRLGDDSPEALGSFAQLTRFALSRATDRVGGVAVTESLLSVFGLKSGLAALPRGLGLAALDQLGFLKRGLANRMLYGF